MSMTVYTAHVYVVDEDKTSYFELSYDNEMDPELAIKDSADSFIDAFIVKENREKLISEAFDANYLWEDEEPYYLNDEIEFSLDPDDPEFNEYSEFCKEIKAMDNVQYVLFAVDSNKQDWMGYASYWYDAIAFDCVKRHLYSIEWRGTELHKNEDYWEEKPFYKSTAEGLIKRLESGEVNQIDLGNFELNGKIAGKVTEKDLSNVNNSAEKVEVDEETQSSAENNEEAEQIARIASLTRRVDEIDFANKAFVFDRLDYVPINGEFCGPDSPEHPTVKRVIEAGGLMRKSVSGKTDYLVLNNHAAMSGMGKKCKDALAQIDKGNNITIITVDNLLEVLGE